MKNLRRRGIAAIYVMPNHSAVDIRSWQFIVPGETVLRTSRHVSWYDHHRPFLTGQATLVNGVAIWTLPTPTLLSPPDAGTYVSQRMNPLIDSGHLKTLRRDAPDRSYHFLEQRNPTVTPTTVGRNGAEPAKGSHVQGKEKEPRLAGQPRR